MMNLITKAKNSLKNIFLLQNYFWFNFQMTFTRIIIWPYEKAAFIVKTKNNFSQGSRHGERETVFYYQSCKLVQTLWKRQLGFLQNKCKILPKDLAIYYWTYIDKISWTHWKGIFALHYCNNNSQETETNAISGSNL